MLNFLLDFFQEIEQQLRLLPSQLSNEGKPKSNALFSQAISMKKILFCVANPLEKCIERNK